MQIREASAGSSSVERKSKKEKDIWDSSYNHVVQIEGRLLHTFKKEEKKFKR